MSICLIQVLDYEAQKHMKRKRILECKNCPVKESCAEWVKNNEEDNRNKSTISKFNRNENK